MQLRGLTIVISTPHPTPFHTAMTMACASAALGHPTRVFFDKSAVELLRRPVGSVSLQSSDTISLLTISRQNNVEFIACQTGLATAGLSASDLGIQAGGMVDLLATLNEDRIVVL